MADLGSAITELIGALERFRRELDAMPIAPPIPRGRTISMGPVVADEEPPADGVLTLAYSTDFGGEGITFADRGIPGVMAGADYSYALSATPGWMSRPRFNIGNAKGTWEINRWAWAVDHKDEDLPVGYTTGRTFGQCAIASGKLRVRAEPRPAALDGLTATRTNSIAANGYSWVDTGVEYPWITAQPTTQHYVQFGGEWAVEAAITWANGKASFPGIYMLATDFEHRLYEIDIFEGQGDEPNKTSFNILINGSGVGIGDWWFIDRGLGDTSGSEHTFRAEFVGGILSAHIDGQLIGSLALTAPIWQALDFYLIVQNQILDWDDQWIDGGGETGGGAPNVSHPIHPTHNPSDLLVDHLRVYSTPQTRLSGRAFPLGGSTAWIPPSLAGTAPAVVLDFPGNRYYAFGENQARRTLVVPRVETDPENLGYELVGPAGGAAFSRRGVWVFKATVPTTASPGLDCLLSLADTAESVGRWAYVVLNSTHVIAGVGGAEPTIAHGLTPGATIKIAVYIGADVGSKLWAGAATATGSMPAEYIGEYARFGVSAYGNEHPLTSAAPLAAWYDLATAPSDAAIAALFAAL